MPLMPFDGGPAKPFITVEVMYANAEDTPLFATGGHGTRAHGTFVQFGFPQTSLGNVLASDMGYRTRHDDPDGVIAYPPVIDPGFAIDVSIALDIGKTNVAAAWGSVVLSNTARDYDQTVANGFSDGRPVHVLKGTKSFDAGRQSWTDPSVTTLVEVFNGMAEQWYLTETALTVPLRDATHWLERPYQGRLYRGTDANYEGPTTLKGVSRPRTRGGTNTNPVCNVTPTLIDQSALIYQYNDGPGTVAHLYEGGAEVFVYDGDFSTAYGISPAPGHYRTDNSCGVFRLGSNPVHAITADVTGGFPNHGAVSTWASLIYWMLVEDMGVPMQNIGTQFAVLDAAFPYVAGQFFPAGSRVTGVSAIDPFLVGVGAHLVPFANGRLEPMMLRVVSGSPSATFSLPNIFAIVAVRLPPSLTPPPRRISVGYNVNYTVQTSDLNYSGVSTHLDFIAQKSGIVAASSSGSTHDAYPRATEPDIIMGALLKVDDANQVAEDLLALFGSRLRLYDITVPADIAEGIEIGGVVEIRYPIDDLDAGKLGRVVRRNLVAGDVVATLRVLI